MIFFIKVKGSPWQRESCVAPRFLAHVKSKFQPKSDTLGLGKTLHYKRRN